MIITIKMDTIQNKLTGILEARRITVGGCKVNFDL